MAIDFIQVNTAKQLGLLAVQTANLIYQVQANLTKLSGAIGHSNDGTTYTTEEAVFGLNSGAGANFATLVGLVNTIFNTNTDVTGANRLSQLNEFCARLAGQ